MYNLSIQSNLSFTSNKNPQQNFESFKNFAEETDLRNQIYGIVRDKRNYISEGSFSKTYKIPDNDNFVIKVLKLVKQKNLLDLPAIKPVKDVFEQINVGQAIAKYGEGVQILIKQEGIEYGLPFSYKEFYSEKPVIGYIQGLRKMSKISQDGYNRFADEVKTVWQKGYYVDFYNSNNILLDKDSINLVDINRHSDLLTRLAFRNNRRNLLRLIVDEQNLFEILQVANDVEKAVIANFLKIINAKLSAAMEHSGLNKTTLIDKFAACIGDRLVSSGYPYPKIETVVDDLIKMAKR